MIEVTLCKRLNIQCNKVVKSLITKTNLVEDIIRYLLSLENQIMQL
jgi:hypothetical protein